MDLFRYDPIIRSTLAQLKVPANQREDMTQECYLVLLEHEDGLKAGLEKERSTDIAYAEKLCKGRIWNVWNKEHQQRASHKTKPNVRFDSLSDPKVFYHAKKVAAFAPEGISRAQLWDAIQALPPEEYEVIYRTVVEDKGRKETAQELGISVDKLDGIRKRAVRILKKHFEVG
jgi:RNA polymerase sigma factor (sigma-70 family)